MLACSFAHNQDGPSSSRTEQGLVGTATTGNDTDHTTGCVLDNLLGTAGKLNPGLALLGVVADDGNVVAGSAAEGATVAGLLFDVGDDGTLGNGVQREDVSDSQGGVLARVDELASVHSLVGDEGLGDDLEPVGVTELDLSERSTTAGIVDNLLHDAPDVSMALGEVMDTELSRRLVETGVSRCKMSSLALCAGLALRIGVALTEDGSTTLSLVADHATHGD